MSDRDVTNIEKKKYSYRVTARIIDNKRVKLVDVLAELAPNYSELSIATGYWDLQGLQLVFESLQKYDSVRLLIGQEPLPLRYVRGLDLQRLDETFPEEQMVEDLQSIEQSSEFRDLVVALKGLIAEGRFEVRVYRGGFLHAKTYIFGSLDSKQALGIIGSSNFTRAGLTANIELNALESDTRIVKSQPVVESDEHGHLSWFREMWESEHSEVWNGKFSQILESSPVGDRLFSPYLMYVKVLYELFSDELVPDTEVSSDIESVLYEFQLRNAKLLLRKLLKNGLAMLADSVGLGKTITAGAVIRHYLEEVGARRVYVIAPASLCAQWREDLAKVHGIFHGFEVLSMQDLRRIQSERAIDKYAGVDLFVIDEAHNLRSGSGTRHDELLDWFSDNPGSHVLLLTATPINNSLTDFVNQIQLAAKGKLESFPVVYPTSKKNEIIDFFDAVQRLTKDIRAAEKEGRKPDFDKVQRVMRQGLRHFLVRTTRSGIEREFGGINHADGTVQRFPKSRVIPSPYKFSADSMAELERVTDQKRSALEGCKLERLKLTWLLELTQRAEHPLDSLTDDSYENEESSSPFERIFQALLLLGFAPYKTEIYKHKFFGKTPEEIQRLGLKPDESFRVSSQLGIHNMLRITLLKRLESSHFALKKSLETYLAKVDECEELLLSKNIISTPGEIRNLRAEYGDDLEEVDFESDSPLHEHVVADPAIFDIDALQKDLHRDRELLKVLIEMCGVLAADDDKLRSLGELLKQIRSQNPSGRKVLVFSYFSDTIQYLQENLGNYFSGVDLESVAGFTNGKSKSEVERLARRFSPVSKGGVETVAEDGELELLFSTDVLSEGQNLQDCGVLINFDLHWNPVRMIQRNGRINRLGSPHSEVYIYNIHPDVDLDAYLTLVDRLEQKIDRIRFTVGTDQSVLGEAANPIEYLDELEDAANTSSPSLGLYDPAGAERHLQELDDDGVLLSEDEFVLDLRHFERSATEEDRQELSRIPLGKWGSLNHAGSEQLDGASALGLIRVTGDVIGSEGEFTNHIFVTATESYGAVEHIDALTAIRARPDQSTPLRDTISVDRNMIVTRSKQVAATHVRSTPSYFRITPTTIKVLDALKEKSPDVNLHDALLKITTKQEHKKARSLILRGSRDIKESGHLLPAIVEEMAAWSKNFGAKETPQKQILEEDIKGVLFFGR